MPTDINQPRLNQNPSYYQSHDKFDDRDNGTRRLASALGEDTNRNSKPDDLVDTLEQEGVINIVPTNVYPGMRLITPRSLINSGLTRYSHTHIHSLAERDLIESVRIGPYLLLTLQGVKQLLDREQESLSAKLHRGQRPGGSWHLPANQKPPSL
jgi:hypothetical protein